jgi:hypothetical protein
VYREHHLVHNRGKQQKRKGSRGGKNHRRAPGLEKRKALEAAGEDVRETDEPSAAPKDPVPDWLESTFATARRDLQDGHPALARLRATGTYRCVVDGENVMAATAGGYSSHRRPISRIDALRALGGFCRRAGGCYVAVLRNPAHRDAEYDRCLGEMERAGLAYVVRGGPATGPADDWAVLT